MSIFNTENIISTTLSATTIYGDGSNITNVTHNFTGSTTINFGFNSGLEDNYTTTAVTNNNVFNYSHIIFRIDLSDDHNSVEDSLLEGITLMASDIIDGVGFTLNASALNNSWGTYNVFYKIIN